MLGRKLAVAAILLCSSAYAAEDEIPAYKATMEAKGVITSIGSDTLNNLMVLWAEEFKKTHPGTRFEIEGKGGATAMGAMVGGVSDVGPMSRPPNPKEIELFNEKLPDHGLVMFTVAMDALCMVVHKDNPLEQLSLTQVDAIYSTTFNRGNHGPITQWAQLGIEGDLVGKKIQLLGRNSASGAYGHFKHVVLLNGDYRDDVQEQPGSAAIVAASVLKPDCMGYVSYGYVSLNAKCLRVKDKASHVAPSLETIRDGSYPISRNLYIVVPVHKKLGIKPEVQEFLRLVFSREGQEVVKRDGFVPLDLQQCRQGHRLLETKASNLND